jgi:hypothetical protein
VTGSYKTPIRHQNHGYTSDTYPILCGYVSTEYPKKKKKKIGYWGRYVLTTIAHYQIRFGQRDGGGCGCQGRRKGVGAADGGWIQRHGGRRVDPASAEDDVWIQRHGGRRVDPATAEDGVWIRRP